MNSSCDICCEAFNTKRKCIECPFCNKGSCLDCVKNYITRDVRNPTCMFCAHEWSDDFVDSIVDTKFKNTKLKSHRELILFDREKALMPQTQHKVEEIIAQKKYDTERQIISDELEALHQKLRNLDDEFYTNKQLRQNKPSNISLSKVCPCGDCRGFLDTKWHCGICDNTVCKHCEEVLTDVDNHECNKDTIKTIALLKKDTKNCPRCAALIHKISGCSQMFCIKCRCIFDYNTCIIQVTGVIHNPEYFRYMRENNNDMVPGADGNQQNNGVLPEYMDLINACTKLDASDVETDKINYIYHSVSHFIGVEIDGLNTFDVVEANEKLRISFMMKTINETEFKIQLQRKDKLARKKRAFFQLFEMVGTVSADILRRFAGNGSTTVEVFESLANMRQYALAEFDKIDARFGSKNGMLRQTLSRIIPYEQTS